MDCQGQIEAKEFRHFVRWRKINTHCIAGINQLMQAVVRR